MSEHVSWEKPLPLIGCKPESYMCGYTGEAAMLTGYDVAWGGCEHEVEWTWAEIEMLAREVRKHEAEFKLDQYEIYGNVVDWGE